jgi:hypothetical protein
LSGTYENSVSVVLVISPDTCTYGNERGIAKITSSVILHWYDNVLIIPVTGSE